MKTRIFTFLFIFMSVGLMAQTQLTFTNNSLRDCDTNKYEEMDLTDPGNPGPNQKWDFSSIKFVNKNQVSILRDAPSSKHKGNSNYNLLLVENGYEYFMNSTKKELEELGYENSEKRLTLLYSDPVVKMKYPFSYRDQFTDHFDGLATYDGTSEIKFYGDHTVTADGYGTLILPDNMVFKGALRVKSVKTGHQINTCGTTEINIVKYSWYANGYRYPLLSLNVVETKSNGCGIVTTTTAFSNTKQSAFKSGVLDANAQTTLEPVEIADVKVEIAPNPFTDQLRFNYLLTVPMNVSIEVYDTSGKTYGWIVRNQLQTEGLHNGELNASNFGLSPGMYFMRFTFDNQIVIQKVVKL